MVQWIARIKDMALLIIAVAGVATLSTGAWSDVGWVTKGTYALDKLTYVTQPQYLDFVTDTSGELAVQEKINEQINAGLSEIKALLTIVPQLKALIRIRCDGGRGLDATIDGLKRQYREMTGSEYVEPECGSPELSD
jgi:hypothetical protein